MAAFSSVVSRLRAVAEPSRLRLLAILLRGEFAVNELTTILGQSQPRVSRHLKVLSDAGLLERFREQHWIYYRVPATGDGREYATRLLSSVDPVDHVLAADAARVEAVVAQRRGDGAAADDAHGRAPELAAVLASELGEQGRGALFYYGAAPTGVLTGIASRARRVLGMNASRLEVQHARAALHSRGLSHCVLQQGELTSLPAAAAEYDVAILDRTVAVQPRPGDALREAGRLLGVGGELIWLEDYDAVARRVPDRNPLAALRGWLDEAGLICTRLRPIDVDGQHLVLAVAHPHTAVTAAA